MDKFNLFKDKKDCEDCFIICSKKTLCELLCGKYSDKDQYNHENDDHNRCHDKWDDNSWDDDKWDDDKWDDDKWTNDKWDGDKWEDKTCKKTDKLYNKHNKCEPDKKDCCEKKCCEKDNCFDKF